MSPTAIEQEVANEVTINGDTKELVETGVSDNTIRAHGKALLELHKRRGTEFNDTVLAGYITSYFSLAWAEATMCLADSGAVAVSYYVGVHYDRAGLAKRVHRE